MSDRIKRKDTVFEKEESTYWVLVTSRRNAKDELYVTVFNSIPKTMLYNMRAEGYTFVCWCPIIRLKERQRDNWKRGKGIVDNLTKKGVADIDVFISVLISYAENKIATNYEAHGPGCIYGDIKTNASPSKIDTAGRFI